MLLVLVYPYTHAYTMHYMATNNTLKVKARAPKAAPVVRQAKVLRDAERTTSDGSQRSKGIGFVEFTQHEDALVALRQLNNNPDVFGMDIGFYLQLQVSNMYHMTSTIVITTTVPTNHHTHPTGRERRPIVEFAIDNVKALKARESKAAARRVQQEKRAGGTQRHTATKDDNIDNNNPSMEEMKKTKKQRKPRPQKKRKQTAEQTTHQEEVATTNKAAAVSAPQTPPAETPAAATVPRRKKRTFPVKGPVREDALDDMVARYKAAMFGGGGGGGGTTAHTQTGSSKKALKGKQRWFD